MPLAQDDKEKRRVQWTLFRSHKRGCREMRDIERERNNDFLSLLFSCLFFSLFSFFLFSFFLLFLYLFSSCKKSFIIYLNFYKFL